MQRPNPESRPADVAALAPPRVLSPAHWEAMFERVATTVAVLVDSVALVTRRYPPEVRTAALAGMWSGFVPLSAAGWGATAAAAGLSRRLTRRRRAGDRPARARRSLLAQLGAVTVRAFAPFTAPVSPTSEPAFPQRPTAVSDAAPLHGPGRRRRATRGRADHRQLARAAGLMAVSAAAARSAGVLGSTWQPLCAGLVEALAVASVYRLAQAYRRDPAGQSHIGSALAPAPGARR